MADTSPLAVNLTDEEAFNALGDNLIQTMYKLKNESEEHISYSEINPITEEEIDDIVNDVNS